MSDAGKSCLVTESREFTLEAYGKNKAEAVGTIFGKFKKTVYASTNGLIIHMEPEDVFMLEQREKTKQQKALGFFAPREIQNTYVKMKIVATVKYIPN
ncbi:MAG: DUF4312 family protein [Angelakisella sp.]